MSQTDRALRREMPAIAEAEPCRAEVADLVAVGLVRRHLMRVMDEANQTLRRVAASGIYARNCFVVGPDEILGCGPIGPTRYGWDAACVSADRLHARWPGYRFTTGGVAVRSGTVACQRWTFGPSAYPARHRGVEVALCGRDGIEACFSILDEGLRPLDLTLICDALAPEDGTRRGSHQSWVREGARTLAEVAL